MRENDKDHVIDNDLAIHFVITDELRAELRKLSIKGLLALASALRNAEKARNEKVRSGKGVTPGREPEG